MGKTKTVGAKYTLKKGRVYIHQKCGEATGITDEHFAGLCNPFEPCLGTICATCGRPDGLKSFKWSDTGETLAAYRARLLNESPPFYRLWTYALSPLLGVLVGGIGAAVFFQKNLVTDFAIGAVIGAPVLYFVVGPKVIRAIAGDRFYTSP